MSYPSLPLLNTSTAERDAGFEPVRATNGVLKVRRAFSAEKTSFNLEHVLTDAQRSTLEAAYVANRTANLTFTWPLDGVAYTVRFAAAPVYSRNGPWWRARVRLEEV